MKLNVSFIKIMKSSMSKIYKKATKLFHLSKKSFRFKIYISIQERSRFVVQHNTLPKNIQYNSKMELFFIFLLGSQSTIWKPVRYTYPDFFFILSIHYTVIKICFGLLKSSENNCIIP